MAMGRLGVDTFGHKDTGTIEQGLPGDAELAFGEHGDELTVQSIAVLAIGEMQDEADRVSHPAASLPRHARGATKVSRNFAQRPRLPATPRWFPPHN